jgi:hypothetical protein
MSKFHIWGDLPQVTFKTPPTDKTEQKKPAQHIAALEISLVLREIGKDPIAIDTADMERKNLRAMFQGFDPENITPNELSLVGKELLSRKLIDNHTAELFQRTGLEFDTQGRVLQADTKMNALDILAGRIAEMATNEMRGDPYAKMLRPDYVKAIHVLQNLQAFGSTGDTFAAARHKALGKADVIKAQTEK